MTAEHSSMSTVAAPTYSEMRLGEILVARGFIAQDLLDGALAMQVERGGRLGDIVVSQKLLSEKQLLQALAEQLGLVVLEKVDDREIPDDLITAVPINFAKQYRLMPVGRSDDGRVRV